MTAKRWLTGFVVILAAIALYYACVATAPPGGKTRRLKKRPAEEVAQQKARLQSGLKSCSG